MNRDLPQSPLVDVHTHLYDKKLIQDIDYIIKEAQLNRVNRIIVVSEDYETACQVLQLCNRYPQILKPGLGLHPCSVHSRDQISEMCKLIIEHKDHIVCIGEVGLDYTPNILKELATKHATTPDVLKQLQQEALLEFCKLSLETGLALNVHSRSAGRPCIKLLQENGAKQVLMHCFDGSIAVAKQAYQSGYFFSIPANICRSKHVQELAKALPLDHLLLETDSPALTPYIPEHNTKEELSLKLQNVRNEPKNALLSCQKIAEVKRVSVELVAETTTRNARKLFPRIFTE
jgi:TatD DNase family protein